MVEVEYEGGFAPGAPIQMEVRLPVSDEQLAENIRSALSRGLPSVQEAEGRFDTRLMLVANGPSAVEAPLASHVPSAAFNGALRLFNEARIAPTYWVACDPQPLVADFLDEAPEDTEYLVASKCHPSVFDSLLSRGRRVKVWNILEPGSEAALHGQEAFASCVSVTLTALKGLLPCLGWRSFEIWGWDGCLTREGRSHAAEQTHERAEVGVQVGSRLFRSTPVWAIEAEDALCALGSFPYPLDIRGGGMFSAIMSEYWRAEVQNILSKALIS